MAPSLKPLIGITSSVNHNEAGIPVCQIGQAYVTAVCQAGGLPVMIPVGAAPSDAENLLMKFDGLLVSGGGDIDPQRFDGIPHPKVDLVSPERDDLEIALVHSALAIKKPLLAICRGHQVLNVALGGTLHTHIQDQVGNPLKHDWYPNYPRDKYTHSVSLKCESQLDRIYSSDEIRVNSLHHQGIAQLAIGLTATAFASDGLVEGVEVVGTAFAIGVQWHPECLPDDPGSQNLFKAFIEAC